MRDLCVLLARETSTPIPYYLSLPWVEVREWEATVIAILKKGG